MTKTKTTAELLAEYNVLATYDLIRSVKYGDMANSRRGREIDRLAGELIDAGVPVGRDGHFPTSSVEDLAAAWQRVARPRIARVTREEYRHASRYTRATVEAWRMTRVRLGLDGNVDEVGL